MLTKVSIDLEEWYHSLPISQWDMLSSNILNNCYKLLEVLEEYSISANLFCVGYVANRYPNLIRDISESGHIIDSHSYWHKLLDEHSAKSFKDDLLLSKNTLEQIIQKPVHGYRLPSFSYDFNNSWFYNILIDSGFKYDSSLIQRGFCENIKSTIQTYSSSTFKILPVHSPSFLKFYIPALGGTYFKLSPLFILKYLKNNLHNYHLYFHVRDLYKEKTSSNISFFKYIIHNNFQNSTLNKFIKLISD